MSLQLLNETLTALVPNQTTTADVRAEFAHDCSSLDSGLREKNNCYVVSTSDEKSVVFIGDIGKTIDLLSALPFSRTQWCALLFYPIEYREDRILQCLTARLLSRPSAVLLQALQTWIEECGEEFTRNSLLLIGEIIDTLSKQEVDESIKTLISAVRETLSRTTSNEEKPTFEMRFNPSPINIGGTPIKLPEWTTTSGYAANILNKDFLQISEQCMVCELSFLRMVRPKDYFIYLRESTRSQSNISVYLNWSTSLAHWVAYSVINQKNEMIREMAYKNFLQLAVKCIEIKNFNTFNSIIEGLQHHSLMRMKKTLELRTPEEVQLMEKLIEVQAKVQHSEFSLSYGTPCVPYLSLLYQTACCTHGEGISSNRWKKRSWRSMRSMTRSTRSHRTSLSPRQLMRQKRWRSGL